MFLLRHERDVVKGDGWCQSRHEQKNRQPRSNKQEPSSNTLPETNIPPPIDGWKMKCPFGMAYFQGRTFRFRECIVYTFKYIHVYVHIVNVYMHIHYIDTVQ